MAKAKTAESSVGKTAPAAKKPASKGAKKAAGAPAGLPTPAAGNPVPRVDTKLAASTAAAMVGNRGSKDASGSARNPMRESAAFRSLKENAGKRHSGGIGDILGVPVTGKKSNQPFTGGGQTFRNQTFGADVSRSSVPRRTGGG